MSFKAFMIVAAFALAVILPQRATAQSRRLPSHNFKFEIQNDNQGRPQLTITNLSAKTLTAAAIAFSVSSEIEPQGSMGWDAVVQRGPMNHPEAQHPPLEPGASMTMHVPHRVGGPT